MSSELASAPRRNTIVNLKHVQELPLRNALETFDRNGDGKIDITDLQKILYWYGCWKYASIGLCFTILALVWSTFGLTIWAINLTKEYTVTNGVLTGGEEVVKMSVAKSMIPLSWVSLLDRRHLDELESITVNVAASSGKFTKGTYHMKLASYLHTSSEKLKLFGQDGSVVWITKGTIVFKHPTADHAILLCGSAVCNTLAVDVTRDYAIQLAERAKALTGDVDMADTIEGHDIIFGGSLPEVEGRRRLGDMKNIGALIKELMDSGILQAQILACLNQPISFFNGFWAK